MRSSNFFAPRLRYTSGMTARCAALVLLPVLPLAALAQGPDPDPMWIGAGVRTRPAYDGSAAQRTDLIPTVRYYGAPWFARTTQGILEGGARTELARGLNVGAQLAYEGGRLASESDFLRTNNVPNINPSASVGLHVEWDQKLGPMPVTLLARGRHFVDSDRGAQADLRFTAIVFGRGAITAAVFIQATWADSKSNQSFYGITPAQSTKLSAYSAGSGPLFASGGLLWGVDLSRGWIVVGKLEARPLHGGAAPSPLAGRASDHHPSASVAYRCFG